jgi:hypothetical protein
MPRPVGYPFTMRRFLAGLSILVACAVSYVVGASSHGLARAEAAILAARWSYLCVDANGVDDLLLKANAAGMRGWEMVGSGSNGSGGTSWCFKQARP